MKLRYYMRGLGIGMIVTALVMGIATRESLPLTDAEIKAKALALGMVEEDSVRLSDIQPSQGQDIHGEGKGEPEEGQPENTGDKEPDSQEDQEETPGTDGDVAGETEPGQAQGSTSAGENTPEDDKPEDGTPQDDTAGTEGDQDPEEADAGIVTITVEDGAGSYKVCEQLVEAGLVEDAWEFDKYLIDNNCSKKVHAGTHQIPVGAGWEEIMKIITKTGN